MRDNEKRHLIQQEPKSDLIYNQSSMHSQLCCKFHPSKQPRLTNSTVDRRSWTYLRDIFPTRVNVQRDIFPTRVNVQRMGSTILNVNSINLQQLIILKKTSVSSYAVYFTVC